MYKDLVADGHGNTDHSSLYSAIEKINKKWNFLRIGRWCYEAKCYSLGVQNSKVIIEQ